MIDVKYSSVHGKVLHLPNGNLMLECCCDETGLYYRQARNGHYSSDPIVTIVDFSSVVPVGRSVQSIQYHFFFSGGGVDPDRVVLEYPDGFILLDETTAGTLEQDGTETSGQQYMKVIVFAPVPTTAWDWILEIYVTLVP
jgi:hypothetical protein